MQQQQRVRALQRHSTPLQQHAQQELDISIGYM
jgi:hypothetical protein